MKLHVQLYEMTKRYGADMLGMTQLAAMMDDEEMFRPFEQRPYKALFRLMSRNGYAKAISDMGQWRESDALAIEKKIGAEYSGNADIHYAVQSIAFALGWIADVDTVRIAGVDITQDVGLAESEVPYISHGSSQCIGTMIPSAMALPVHHQLNVLAKEEGGVAEYVMEQMGIGTKKELEEKVSGEQIDGIAMAIRQMSCGRGFILGDMTGIGKGRQVAMLLKWATMHGNKPVFVTEKSILFNDLYRDLFDVGYGDLRPFILNSDKDARVVDPEGNLIYDRPSATEMDDFKSTKSVPAGYDYLLLTYSQLSRKESKNWKVDCVREVVRGTFLIMDESHNASGEESNVGMFFREAVQLASGVCFSSATYAKYPSSMPVYALKTAIGEANIPADQLIDIVSHGGPILQEVMAKGLVNSGSMIRRQRDMKDVERTLYASSDPNHVELMRQRYDQVITLIQDIREFQEQFIKPYLRSLDAEVILKAENKIGKNEQFVGKKTRISYMRFSALMTPTIRQLLFAIKADDAIEVTLRELKDGRKPIIQVSRTMESSMSQLVKAGMTLDKPDFALALIGQINNMFKYAAVGVTKSNKGRSVCYKQYRTNKEFDLTTLDGFFGSTCASYAYDYLVKKISSTDTGLPLSPIDYYVESMKRAGYNVGELTQRKNTFRYTDVSKGANSEVLCVKRQAPNKKAVASDFNSGKLDVLIGNRVMSSGISLHSSSKFQDKRQRVVITWEQQDSADRQTQFDGRADRTGQISHCAFVVLTSPIPAEQRFLMMNDRKQRSLNANVEANQHSDNNCVDMINQYGAKVAFEFLTENPELNSVFDGVGDMSYIDDQKIAYITDFMRTLGLVSCKEQEDILNELQSKYNELISYLDDIGENELFPKALPLNAKLLDRSVFFVGKINSRSQFGQDAMLDEVEVDVLRRPMREEQIRPIMRTLSSADKLKPVIVAYQDSKCNDIELYYDNLKQDVLKQLQAAKQAKLIYTPSRLAKLSQRAYNDAQKLKEIGLIREKTHNMVKLMDCFTPGMAVGIPSSLQPFGEINDVRMLDYVSVGLFLGYKQVGNRPTGSNIKAVFAVNDGRQRLDIPLSEPEKLETIKNQTSLGIMRQRLVNVSLDTWNSLLSNNTREKAYIVTGNLLLGISAAKQFGKNIGNSKLRQLVKCKGHGHLINYTDDSGRLRNGYLMPRIFKPADVKLYGPKDLSN